MLKILEKNHLMVDIETLLLRTNAVIIQIGAVKFNLKDGIKDEFIVNIDSFDASNYNCDIDKETIKWWLSQPSHVRKTLQNDKKSLYEGLVNFKKWVGDDEQLMWCNGGSFDFPILNWSYKECDIELPWKYWDECDFRTVCTFFDYKFPKTTNTHNALSDSKSQVEHLLTLFNEISKI